MYIMLYNWCASPSYMQVELMRWAHLTTGCNVCTLCNCPSYPGISHASRRPRLITYCFCDLVAVAELEPTIPWNPQFDIIYYNDTTIYQSMYA